MGFFDEIAGKAMEKVRGANGDQVSGASGGILEILRAQPGGLSGLVQNFHDKGLGAIVVPGSATARTYRSLRNKSKAYSAMNR